MCRVIQRILCFRDRRWNVTHLVGTSSWQVLYHCCGREHNDRFYINIKTKRPLHFRPSSLCFAYLDRDETKHFAGVVVDDGEMAHVGGDHFLHARLNGVRPLRRHHLGSPRANLLHLQTPATVRQNQIERRTHGYAYTANTRAPQTSFA